MPKSFSKEQRDEWKKKIQDQHKSGLSISQWCQKNEELTHRFYYWEQKLFHKQSEKDSFIEITEESSTVSSSDSGIEVKYAGISIHLESCFDSAAFKKCMKVIKELC